jgi:hypothetical protein
MKVIQRFAMLSMTIVFVLSACSGTATPPASEAIAEATPAAVSATQAEAAPTQQLIPSIREALANLEYPLELASSGKAQLVDGYFEEPSAPDSATKTIVQLADLQFGDVNGDGSEDALVTLVVDPGGSGTFTYLVLVLNEEGKARPVASVLLGDRIIVKSMQIDPDGMKVSLLTRQPDEPMTADPKVEVTRIFKLLNDALVEEK